MELQNAKKLLLAVNFAADKHQHQRRKNKEKTPYINHPLRVANILAEADIDDIDILIAAILHDTVEDTDTTFDEIESTFGKTVRDYVYEVTDDKSLNKAERKRQQISHSSVISDGAKCIKMADKTHNLQSFLTSSPVGWTVNRIQGYFVWSKAVLEGCRNVNKKLESYIFDKLFKDTFTIDGEEYLCIPNDVSLEEVLDEYLSEMEVTND